MARSGAWNVLAFVITAGSALGVSVLIGRSLGPARFGRYSYIIWIVRTAAVLGALGIPAASSRTVSELLGANDIGAARGIFRSIVRFHVLVAPFLFAITGLVVWKFSHDAWVGVFLGMTAVFLMLAYTFEQTLAGFRRFELAARNSALGAGVQLALIGGAAALGAGLRVFLFLQAAVGLFGLAVWGTVTRSRFKDAVPTAVSRDSRRRFVRLASLMAVISLSDSVLWGRPEVFFLQKWWSEKEVGLYSAALVLATLTSSLPLIASRVLTPEFSWLRGGGREGSLKRAFPAICTYIALFALPLGIGGALVARDLLLVAYGKSFVSAATAAGIVMAGSVFVAVAGPASSATITGPHPGFMAKLAGALAVINLVLDVLLIPRFGIVGAAVATIVSQAASIMILFRYARKRLGLSFPWSAVFKLGVAAGIASILGRLAAAGMEGLVGLLITLPIAATIYLTLVLGLKVVSWDEIKRVIRQPRKPSGPVSTGT